MSSLVVLALLGFLSTLALTPLIRRASLRFGFVDMPDQRRRHRDAVPRTGGIAIFVTYAISLGVLSRTHTLGIEGAGIFCAALLIFLVGLFDDFCGVKPWQKIAVQSIAALIVYWTGIRVSSVGGWETGVLGLPLTMLWLVGASNAFNLIDGMDGLAAGVGFFATMTAFAAALIHGNDSLALVTAPLAGCLLAFLRYNFNPASIFLGDCGSLTIGFLLGCYGVIWSQKSATALGMTAPLMTMAFPLLDTGIAILRRFLRREPIFTADRGHIHHRLLARGWTPRRVVLILYGVCGVAAVVSLLQSGWLLLAVAALLLVSVQSLRYPEFSATKRFVAGGRIRRVIQEEIRIAELRQGLRDAYSTEECWVLIRDAARDFEMAEIHCRLSSEYTRQERFIHADPLDCWQCRVPLSEGRWVNFSREFAQSKTEITSLFADALRSELHAVRVEIP